MLSRLLPVRTRLLFAVILCTALPNGMCSAEMILSPDRKITVSCDIGLHDEPYPDGACFYLRIQYEGITVISDSPLGLDIKDGPPLLTDLRLYSVKKTGHVEAFAWPWGRSRQVSVAWNEALFMLQERRPPFRLMNIRVRVSDDGAAFRYELPEQPQMSRAGVTGEHTAFYLPADYRAWALEVPSFYTDYETGYTAGRVSRLQTDTLLALPLVMDTGRNAWISISEAALRGYGGMYLRPDSRREQIRLKTDISVPPHDSISRVPGSLPFAGPWRVVQIAASPGRFAESDLILSLNDPAAFTDTGWIVPGKCVRPDWTDWHTADPALPGRGLRAGAVRHYLRFAAESGFEYLLLDAAWYRAGMSAGSDITVPAPGLDIAAVFREAAELNVGIFLEIYPDWQQDDLEAAFAIYSEWGAAGVKLQGAKRDDQEMIGLYHAAFAAAARHRLMVTFHGSYKPTGTRRTWPNVLTRGAVLSQGGAEPEERCTPGHEAVLPFTRMSAGPLDVSPGCFRTVMEDAYDPESHPPRTRGTRARQLAMYVVYESPLQMVVDYPASYRQGSGFDFIRRVPTVWDSTSVLQGVPGEYIIMLRKSGGDYYLGAMTDWNPRGLQLPLTFLQEGRYKAEIWADGPNTMLNPEDVRYRSTEVDASVVLSVPLGAGGGYAARFSPVRPENAGGQDGNFSGGSR